MSTWHIDTAHSEIGFKVKHLIVSTVRGSFSKFSGTIETDGLELAPARINLEIDANSISTNNEMRDGHLKSADFFNTPEFPTITFASTAFEKKSESEYELRGDITLRGITKPITFSALYNGESVTMNGSRVVSFDLSGSLNRFDFGLNWNELIETGGVAVGEIVKIEATIEAVLA